MFDVILRGGRVVDGSGLPWYRADIGVRGDRIVAIGQLHNATARTTLDASQRVVSPGFLDAHVHGDLAVLADPLHEAAIRQGVTTYIVGQDGVAFAPSSWTTREAMRRYTAGFGGGAAWAELPLLHDPSFLSMDSYLSLFDRRCALNVACLVPNGNVRMEVMGLETRAPTAAELAQMRRLVRDAMEQGAVGLSSGLDYIPSRYADTEELAALCAEIAPYQGVYVTHMRRYDPEGLIGSMDEVFQIGRSADCPVHISHFNSKAELALPHLDTARRAGIDATFDLYCYLAGSTILGMIALPPEVQVGGVEATAARLRDPGTRANLHQWFASPGGGPRGPVDTVRISYVANPEYRHCEGMTLQEAADTLGTTVCDFVCDVLASSGMAVGCVVPHRQRDESDVRGFMTHPGMTAGSDGIFTGSCPHPRGCGCFARYLGYYVREAKVWRLEEAVAHLSYHTARRFGLRDRGLIREGMVADLVVFDPETIGDRATYEAGRQLAVGVDHVLVQGELVLQAGVRTTALPGRGLRRQGT